MKSPSKVLIALCLIPSVTFADDLFSPNDIAILKQAFGAIAGIAVAVAAIGLAFYVMVGRDARLIRRQNDSSRSTYRDAVGRMEAKDYENAKLLFLSAAESFNRPLFELERSLSLLGAADAEMAIGNLATATTLYEKAHTHLLAHPEPRTEPLELFIHNRPEVSRHRAYELALARCKPSALPPQDISSLRRDI